jgi:hypothetical protein
MLTYVANKPKINTHYEHREADMCQIRPRIHVLALVEKHPHYLKNKNTLDLERCVRGDLRQLRADGFIKVAE